MEFLIAGLTIYVILGACFFLLVYLDSRFGNFWKLSLVALLSGPIAWFIWVVLVPLAIAATKVINWVDD